MFVIRKERKAISKRVSLIGNRYGHLIVTEMIYGYSSGKKKKTACVCKCDCGKTCVKTVDYLRASKNNHQSCGCKTSFYRSVSNMTDETGQKFGRLTITNIIRDGAHSMAVCKCECGKVVTVIKSDVISGHTRSCGCLHKESVLRANEKDFAGYKAESGVSFLNKAYRNDHGTWIWACICPVCGSVFNALPAKILSGHTSSCGCARVSSGELKVENALRNASLEYKKQVRFDECRDKYSLPFDFAVYDGNALRGLIEYDGEQHYRPVDFFGGIEAYNNRVRHDKIKDAFCHDRGIPLLRINYSDTIKTIQQKLQTLFIRNDCNGSGGNA